MARSERQVIDGPVGAIEWVLDWPEQPLRGLALVGHPHPLYGGTLDNKVAATLARAFAASGYLAVRPNFRGVGASAGEHDHGRGETDDLQFVLEQARRLPAVAALGEAPPLILSGFSFGSFVASQLAHRLSGQGTPIQTLVLVGSAAGKWAMPNVASGCLIVHGELDETIPLVDVFDWTRPQSLPVVVIPGADHFFHRRLTLLRDLVLRHLAGLNAVTHGNVDDTAET